MAGSYPRDFKRSLRVVASAIVLFFASSFIGGCGSWVFPESLTVPPEAVAEIRGMGSVAGETTLEDGWDGTTAVLQILIVNMGSQDAQEAIRAGQDRLVELGWTLQDGQLPRTKMASSKWEGLILTLGNIDSFDLRDDPRIEDFIEKAKSEDSANSLLLVELRPVE